MHGPWHVYLPWRHHARRAAASGRRGVKPASGEVLYADLLIAADGVKRAQRNIVTDLNDRPKLTGDDAAYRAVISTDLVLQSELRPFVETAEAAA